MATRLRAGRSTEAPMDLDWTSRPSSNVKPAWAQSENDPSTPRKRTFNDSNSPAPAFPERQHAPMFGTGQNVPFIFQTPTPQMPTSYPWSPPSNFSPTKAFPQPSFQEELKDVDMSELTPPKPEQKEEGGRTMALGAMRRVFKSRQKRRGGSRLARDVEDSASESEGDDEAGPLTHNTSNHYTLNLPSIPAPQSDLPYILLGYLQFFFNLSLILVFLYLVLQFILTVQHDVEQRISEYSMDIVQEIAMCSSQYRNNLCASNPIPAMIQQCANWETCMNRDPTIVGRAKVGAELIAEVVNGFVEPISWKTLAFTLTSLSFLTVFINSLLSLFRSRIQPAAGAPPLHHQPSFPLPPATPYPHPYGGYLPPGTPSYGRSWAAGVSDEDLQTPSRRRRLEGGGAAKVK
ncbi:hypothetical protein PLICRDRAFT_44048 [Plicaturopsis crispa FD-325 SS-3]|nr:hypothetical protein PLICRDRAFT_44048 [Plicaturopsis crispa FD-325 SS-3]